MSAMTDPAWRVEISSSVEKKLSKLPGPERGRIFKALERLEENPFQQDVKKFKAGPFWRLRVGRWRVILRVDKGNFVIVAARLGARGDVYK